MPIIEIDFNNFKKYEQHTSTLGLGYSEIKAPNGAGKTSHIDGIAFVYYGTDRFGGRNPQWLIRNGADKAEVIIKTDTGNRLKRTLTSKGTSTLKWINSDDIESTLTQQQLTDSIGTLECFLSAIYPGYFLNTLNTLKRKEVINAALGNIDPYKLIQEMTGYDVSMYDLSKKTTATTITNDRRALEKEVAVLTGKVSHIEELNGQELVEPENLEPLLEREKALRNEISLLMQNSHSKRVFAKMEQNYEKELGVYGIAMDNLAREEAEVTDIENALSFATENFEVKKRENQPTKQKVNEELQLLLSEIKQLKTKMTQTPVITRSPLPARPIVKSAVDSELCPTCGQTVSDKLRESVAKANEQTINKWQEEVRTIEADHLAKEKAQLLFFKESEKALLDLESQAKKLEDVLACIADHEKQLEKAVDSLRAKKDTARAVLVATRNMTKAPPVAPVPPHLFEVEDVGQETELQQLSVRINALNQDWAVYQSKVRTLQAMEGNVSEINERIGKLNRKIEMLQTVEKALKDLPDVMLKKSSEIFKVRGFSLVTEDGDITYVREKDGVPYAHLSNGEKARVDLEISWIIDKYVLKKQTNLMILDNADLVDNPKAIEELSEASKKEGIQFIALKVQHKENV